MAKTFTSYLFSAEKNADIIFLRGTPHQIKKFELPDLSDQLYNKPELYPQWILIENWRE